MLARKATPGLWVVDTRDGIVRVTGRDGQEVAMLTGQWALGTANYLAALGPNTAYMIAEVMWLSEALVRQDQLPSRLRAQLQAVAQALPT
jgi:hypothetical protein